MLATALFVTTRAGAQDVYALFPDQKGWEKTFNYDVYTPDDLWDFIDGAAESYLAQSFVDLHIAEYSKGKQVIRVEIYRHKDTAHGFGIYSQERSPGLNFIDIGANGYQQGTVLNFVNGEYYVKISASTDKAKSASVELEIAHDLSDNIDPDPELPAVLSLFPEEGRLEDRDAFISSSFMGQEFLNNVYKASYKVNDISFNLFIVKEMNAAACEQILRQYMEYTKQPAEGLAQGRMEIRDPYNGDIGILWKDNRIIGITGTNDMNIRDKYLGMVGE